MGLFHMAKAAAALPYAILAAGLSFSVLAAAENYSKVASRAEDGSDVRSACQYVRMKVRQRDWAETVSVSENGTIQILERTPEGDFLTDLYSYDGWLMECLHNAGTEPVASAGYQIVPCEGLDARIEGQVLYFSMGMGGRTERSAVLLKGGEERP